MSFFIIFFSSFQCFDKFLKAKGKDQVGKLGFLELFWTETCLKSFSMALTVSIREGKKEQINLIDNKYKTKRALMVADRNQSKFESD
jgi:hypothetical protein